MPAFSGATQFSSIPSSRTTLPRPFFCSRVPPTMGETMDNAFWLGGIVGALLGVFADFLVRPVQRLLDRRLEDRTTIRSEGLIERLGRDRPAARDFLVLQIL